MMTEMLARLLHVYAGLFTQEVIPLQEFVIEYCGELVRQAVADERQKKYEAENRADYMFANDVDSIIDATMQVRRALS